MPEHTTAQFDQQYYQRYYADPETRAVSPAEQQQQVDFVAAYLNYLQVPVTSIMDMGCGLGVLLEQFERCYPEARLRGVEYSDYLCKKYGWRQGSVVDYSTAPHDLVVCNDVLGYLPKRACARAIDNLATLTGNALYLSVLTSEDVDICDTEHTDMSQKLRPHQWYRKHLDKHFVPVGGGLFLKKPLQFPVWRMERL